MTSKIIQIIKIVCLRPDTKQFERIAKSDAKRQMILLKYFRNKKQETRNKKQETRNKKQES